MEHEPPFLGWCLTKSTQTEPLRSEFVVVTGASTGIGAATARELARRGFHVLAGVRQGTDADALRATNLEPIMLDITNEAEIAALVKHIIDDPERAHCAPWSTMQASRSMRPSKCWLSLSGAGYSTSTSSATSR
jgi:NAD(P)-dependent dehydrogenase (short-subunit alcohol dehydrogenase family)